VAARAQVREKANRLREREEITNQGCRRRCNDGDACKTGKLLPFILQVARVSGTVEEEDAPEERSAASTPPQSRCCTAAVAGLTVVSQPETEAAALQQAKEQQRSGGGGGGGGRGGQITRPCPPAWSAENTERNKNN